MVALELEILAKKFDRFGWDRDRGSAVQDAMIRDWIEALVDFPLDEIRAGCRAAVLANPNRMPNEGNVRAEIMDARKAKVRSMPKPRDDVGIQKQKCTPEQAEAILRRAGFSVRKFDGGKA